MVLYGSELIARNTSSATKVEVMAGLLGGMMQEGTRGDKVHEHASPPNKSWVSSYRPTRYLGPWEISWKLVLVG